MSKQRRLDTPHGHHFITFTVSNFISIFRDAAAARKFLDVVFFYEQRGDVLVHAMAVMPKHVHILLENMCTRSIGAIVRDIKKYYSAWYRDNLARTDSYCRLGEKFQLWQSGFDEVTIGSSQQFWIKYNYIKHNPQKRGLEKESGEYEFLVLRKAPRI